MESVVLPVEQKLREFIMVRESAVKGQFYPSELDTIRKMIARWEHVKKDSPPMKE